MYYDDDYYYQADQEQERYDRYLDQEYERNQSWEWQERENQLNWYEEEQNRQWDQDRYSRTSSWDDEDSWSWSGDEGRSSGGSSWYSGSGEGCTYTSTGSYGRRAPKDKRMGALCMMLLALLAAFLWMLGSKVTLAAAGLLSLVVLCKGIRTGHSSLKRFFQRLAGILSKVLAVEVLILVALSLL